MPVRAKQRLDFDDNGRHSSSMGESLSRQGSAGRRPRPAASSRKRRPAPQGACTEEQALAAKRHCSASAITAAPEPVEAEDNGTSLQYLSDEENDAARANNAAKCTAAAAALEVSLAASPVQQLSAGAHIPGTPATADRRGLLSSHGAVPGARAACMPCALSLNVLAVSCKHARVLQSGLPLLSRSPPSKTPSWKTGLT